VLNKTLWGCNNPACDYGYLGEDPVDNPDTDCPICGWHDSVQIIWEGKLVQKAVKMSMLFSQRKKLADAYLEWLAKPENSAVKDCPFNVIGFLNSLGAFKNGFDPDDL
jgi:hypothetical protein